MQEMSLRGLEEYYENSATGHGWGLDAQINPERLSILDRYVVGPRVLDIGCAHGLYVDYLARRGFDVCGLDFTGAFLHHARAIGRRGELMRGDATSLPIQDAAFDTVLLFDVLEHLPDEADVINELLRVATKRVLIIVPRTTDDYLVRRNLVFSHHQDRTHLRTYTRERLQELFPSPQTIVQEINQDSLRRAVADAVRPGFMRLALRVALRPLNLSFHTEYLVIVERLATPAATPTLEDPSAYEPDGIGLKKVERAVSPGTAGCGSGSGERHD